MRRIRASYPTVPIRDFSELGILTFRALAMALHAESTSVDAATPSSRQAPNSWRSPLKDFRAATIHLDKTPIVILTKTRPVTFVVDRNHAKAIHVSVPKIVRIKSSSIDLGQEMNSNFFIRLPQLPLAVDPAEMCTLPGGPAFLIPAEKLSFLLLGVFGSTNPATPAVASHRSRALQVLTYAIRVAQTMGISPAPRNWTSDPSLVEASRAPCPTALEVALNLTDAMLIYAHNLCYRPNDSSLDAYLLVLHFFGLRRLQSDLDIGARIASLVVILPQRTPLAAAFDHEDRLVAEFHAHDVASFPLIFSPGCQDSWRPLRPLPPRLVFIC